MNQPGARGALHQYQSVGTRTAATVASPHRLIDMLMERALGRIAIAKGHMLRSDAAGKGSNISGAMAIIDGLKTSLDPAAGGDIAGNLDALYDYMNRQLLQANLNDDVAMLDEVAGLLREIKGAWTAIGEQQAVPADAGA